jgi:hypothetical protein
MTVDMPLRVELGTDAAMIGLWDPTYGRHDLDDADPSVLRSEARAGRLFFIDTGADGGYSADIYVDETPGPDVLTMYSQVNRDYLVISESGLLLAGGVEDFVGSRARPSTHEISIPIGRYAVTLHYWNTGQAWEPENLRRFIGAEDYDYYEKRTHGIAWGCILFLVALPLLFFNLWYVAGALFCVWIVYRIVRSRIRASDERYQQIHRRITDYTEQSAEFIFLLKRSDSTELKDGWFNLS